MQRLPNELGRNVWVVEINTIMPPILSKRGVSPEMRFTCSDCGHVTTGLQVIEGEHIHIVRKNPDDPLKSVWRCECCQDDLEDRDRE